MEARGGELRGSVALITGAGSGIGKAAAARFAAAGASVGALSRTEAEIDRTAEEIRAAGGQALPLHADIADSKAMKAAIDRLVAEYGRLDIVFANAGVNGVWAPIDALTPEEWDRTVAINLRGTYLTLHHAVPHLKRAGKGSVIVTSSVNGTRIFSNAGATAYSATKAAQLAMVQMLAVELAPHRIRVNAICPGRIDTAIPDNTEIRGVPPRPAGAPQSRIPLTGDQAGGADDVAELALFLASDRSRHITGTPIWIDGAESLLVG